jgi:ubiquitin-protein ligase
MAQIKIIIRDHTGAKKTPVELPDNVPMRQLIPALVSKMSLPTTQGGQPLTYEMDNTRSGRRLRADDTLQSAGVMLDDILVLLPTATAGAVANPRVRRLGSDHERLQRLVSQSRMIRIISTTGTPPEIYVIQLTCRGIENLNGNEPVFRSDHRLQITLPAGYPTSPPDLRIQTPIFHPNINRGLGTVCIGPWWPAKWLDELVFMVAEMIQYKVPPTRDTRENVYNVEAVNWIRRNRHRIPIDRTEVKVTGDQGVESLNNLIKIGQTDIGSGEDDLLKLINIL